MPISSKLAAIGVAANCMLLPYLYFRYPSLQEETLQGARQLDEAHRIQSDDFKCYETARLYRVSCAHLSPDEEDKLEICAKSKPL